MWHTLMRLLFAHSPILLPHQLLLRSISFWIIPCARAPPALVVNRKLYRAHRHLRLAVLEASKRFEEQQAEHAKQVISAAREASERHPGRERHRVVPAGLVMWHGQKKLVSTNSIRALLDRNWEQQNSLVEKANRSSGRGRRSKKKTVSDMSLFAVLHTIQRSCGTTILHILGSKS
jgi:hypothetical protein